MNGDDFDYTKEKLEYCYLKRNSIGKVCTKFAGKIMPYFMPLGVILFNPGESYKILKNPEFYNFFFNKERRVGMVSGSILSDSQFVPVDLNNDYFSYQRVKAGNYVGVDYLRRNEFPKAENISWRGSFYGFILDDLKGVSWDKYYPISEVDYMDGHYFSSIQRPSLFKLLNEEYLHENSYSQALKNVGMYDKLGEIIENFDLGKKSVYQVTPKANGLLFLTKDSGSSKKREVREKQCDLVPSFV